MYKRQPYNYSWNSGFLNSGVVPDGNSTGWSDTRNLSGIAQNSILDLNVTLQLSGGWNGDLYAYLTHGTGFSVLLNRVGRTGSDELLLNLGLDLQARFGWVHKHPIIT